MPQIQTRQQPVTQITIIESEPGRQEEALSVMAERENVASLADARGKLHSHVEASTDAAEPEQPVSRRA